MQSLWRKLSAWGIDARRIASSFNSEGSQAVPPNSADGYSGLQFFRMPFISSTKVANHAARYALGQKIDEADRADLLRTVGVVGRVFVYVFTVDQLYAQGAVNIAAVHGANKINVHPHIFHEAEVTFTGSIPGENLVQQTNVQANESKNAVATRAEGLARPAQEAAGGVLNWDDAD
jgi:hypothetical protein